MPPPTAVASWAARARDLGQRTTTSAATARGETPCRAAAARWPADASRKAAKRRAQSCCESHSNRAPRIQHPPPLLRSLAHWRRGVSCPSTARWHTRAERGTRARDRATPTTPSTARRHTASRSASRTQKKIPVPRSRSRRRRSDTARRTRRPRRTVCRPTRGRHRSSSMHTRTQRANPRRMTSETAHRGSDAHDPPCATPNPTIGPPTETRAPTRSAVERTIAMRARWRRRHSKVPHTPTQQCSARRARRRRTAASTTRRHYSLDRPPERRRQKHAKSTTETAEKIRPRGRHGNRRHTTPRPVTARVRDECPPLLDQRRPRRHASASRVPAASTQTERPTRRARECAETRSTSRPNSSRSRLRRRGTDRRSTRRQ